MVLDMEKAEKCTSLSCQALPTCLCLHTSQYARWILSIWRLVHLLTCLLLQVSLLVKEGLAASPSCTVVFLLLYFSLLSSAAWWAVLTTSWAVMVFCSLSPATIGTRAPLLHALGWGVPAVLTITCLVSTIITMELEIYFISAF